MSTAKLVPKKAQATKKGRRSQRQESSLPAEMLQSWASRLSFAALTYAAVWLIIYFLEVLFSSSGRYDAQAGGFMGVLTAASVSGALLVAWLARSKRVPTPLLMDLAAVFWVAGTLTIELGLFFGELSQGRHPNGLSWSCVWVVAFALIVPHSPRRTLATGLAAATCAPISYFLASIEFSTVIDPYSLVFLFAPYYICVWLAYAASCSINQLGRDVSEARDLGSYRLTKRLGAGGMGEVWLARHRLLARPAAVKFLYRENVLGPNGSSSQDEQLLARFEREAQATASLTSPHTIVLFDYGQDSEGRCYYAMEFLEGLDLDTLVDRFGAVPPERAVHFLIQACESLQEAHANGLVHRDIKPGNLYACKLGGQYDFLKVLDFGLVKRTQADSAIRDSSRLTQQGTITGTPAFMAPEMALGQDVDHLADIYSLGCVGYWLLAGRLVFEGLPMLQITQHIRTPPARLSRLSEQQIPEELERILESCLEKDPARRPQSAAELGGMLNECPLPRRWSRRLAEEWWRLHQPLDCDDHDSGQPEPVAAPGLPSVG